MTKAVRYLSTSLLALLALGLTLQPARAADEPTVIVITAKRFEFSPNKIVLKKGQPVTLRLSSEDVAHGFFLRALHLDADIDAGKSTDITFTPDKVGTFTLICDHFCGTGHGGMHMVVEVTE
jgi:cytochrome c oxidase subunit II